MPAAGEIQQPGLGPLQIDRSYLGHRLERRIGPSQCCPCKRLDLVSRSSRRAADAQHEIRMGEDLTGGRDHRLRAELARHTAGQLVCPALVAGHQADGVPGGIVHHDHSRVGGLAGQQGRHQAHGDAHGAKEDDLAAGAPGLGQRLARATLQEPALDASGQPPAMLADRYERGRRRRHRNPNVRRRTANKLRLSWAMEYQNQLMHLARRLEATNNGLLTWDAIEARKRRTKAQRGAPIPRPKLSRRALKLQLVLLLADMSRLEQELSAAPYLVRN